MSLESRAGPAHKEEGKEYRVACIDCGRSTLHRVTRSAEYTTDYTERRFSITGWDEYQVIECLGCQTVSFRKCHRDTENIGVDPDTGEEILEEHIELYPSRTAGRYELDDTLLLPPAIQRVYRESLAALRGSMPVLTGIGLRALVETVCKERKASGRNLEERIDTLVNQGVLTRDGAEILHSLRIMGNDAAHEVKPHTTEDLNAAFDVIEYVLTGVYLLPQRAAKLPRRTTP